MLDHGDCGAVGDPARDPKRLAEGRLAKGRRWFRELAQYQHQMASVVQEGSC